MEDRSKDEYWTGKSEALGKIYRGLNHKLQEIKIFNCLLFFIIISSIHWALQDYVWSKKNI